MKTILFQGDSITDAGRARDNNANRGLGYPTLVAAQLGFDFPAEYDFINKGVSGNRIVDVYARIKADIINLKPACMSLLIGVNDVWHEIGGHNGVCAEKFEKIYSMLIEEIVAELPDIKIMLLEPFVLDNTATHDNWDFFSVEVAKRAAATKRVAEKYSLEFIPLQDKFNNALKLAPASYWLADGVHPTSFGHELIAREWINAFLALNK